MSKMLSASRVVMDLLRGDDRLLASCTPAQRSVVGVLRYLAGVGLVAAGYAAAAWVAAPLQPTTGDLTLAWSAAGPAVALLLLLGVRFWPGIWVGAALEELRPGYAGVSWIALGITVGQTLHPILVCLLLRRLGFRTTFARLKDVVAFLPVAVVLGPAIGASIGLAVLVVLAHSHTVTWWSWWMSDARSVLIITPLLIVWQNSGRFGLRASRVLEFTALFGSLGLVGVTAFGLGAWQLRPGIPVVYSLFPWLVWAAFRFGPRGAIVANGVVAALALWATREGVGPFVEGASGASVAATQIFLVVSAVTTLAIAAALYEWQQTAARSEAGLNSRLRHDALTGLPHRSHLTDRLERALSAADLRSGSIGLFLMNLDNFRAVNNSFGHHVADELLVEVGRRVRDCLGPDDVMARMGGDEFAVLVDHLGTEKLATRVAESIVAAFASAFEVVGHTVVVTASLGVAVAGPGYDRADTLMRAADLALHRAKSGGKSACVFFEQSFEDEARERLQFEEALRCALERGELRVHYQPILSLTDGAVVELEALVRWEHPERGLIQPMTFIPLAEETGLIIPLGRWVLEEACRQVCRWQSRYPDTRLVLGVNLSGRQFQDPNLVADIERILASTGFDPHDLKLEITESVAMQDVLATIPTLHRLKGLGIDLAIDDFGTGYSSLSYLKRFPIDTLKIDRSFVDGLGTDPQDTAIVRSVVALARTLGLSVTAEGIETTRQEVELRGLGCDRGQGYLFARPLPVEGIDALLEQPRLRTAA